MPDDPGRGEKETRKAWDEVGRQFSDVGRQIGQHYRTLDKETRTSAQSERQTVSDAINRVIDEMDHAFTGLGNALRDPQTKDSLSKAARSLSDALDARSLGSDRSSGRRARRTHLAPCRPKSRAPKTIAEACSPAPRRRVPTPVSPFDGGKHHLCSCGQPSLPSAPRIGTIAS
jgi:hypothetical protein